MNEGKRTAERQMKIVAIQNQMDSLQDDLVTPSRRFVREGDTELRHKITGKGENRHLFLFNDLVVIARQKQNGRYEFRNALNWGDCRFIVISEQGKVKHGFEIAHESQRYIFSCESKKDQDDWVADFKMMTKELKLKKLEEAKKGMSASPLSLFFKKISIYVLNRSQISCAHFSSFSSGLNSQREASTIYILMETTRHRREHIHLHSRETVSFS